MRKLIELRKEAGVSIADGARMIGCSYGHLWNVEHGFARLKDEQAERLISFYAQKACERSERVASLLTP